jgi:hypothetical protein
VNNGGVVEATVDDEQGSLASPVGGLVAVIQLEQASPKASDPPAWFWQ